MSDGVRTKLCYEELMDKLQTEVQKWLKETPEIRSLLIGFDWVVGQNEFPSATVISKQMDEQTILAMMRQATKLQDHLLELFLKQVSDSESVLAKAATIVRQQADHTDPDAISDLPH